MRPHQARIEVRIVALRLGRPAHFGQRAEAREQLIFREVRRIKQQFRPEAALQAAHLFLLLGRQFQALQRVERIHLLDVDERSPAVTTLGRRVLHVEVQVVAVLRDHREPGVNGFLQHILAVPHQHQVVLGEVLLPVHDVFPAFQRLAVLGQDLLEPAREIAQQLALVRIAELLHQRLALRAMLPGLGRDLLHAHVEILGREDRGNLLDDVLEHRVVLLATDAEHVVHFALHALHVLLVPAYHLGIRDRQRLGMARQVHLGDDLDVALRGVSHDFAEVVLRIEAAVALAAGIELLLQRLSVATPGTHRGESRIFLDFHAPAVVVGQVPVELVDLVVGQPVEMAQDIGLVEEAARHVEHAAAPVEAGLVHDLHGGQFPLPDQHRVGAGNTLIHLRREHLQQRLDGVEFARFRARGHQDAAVLHADAVALLRERLGAHEFDGRGTAVVPAVAQRVEHAGQVLAQVLHVEGVAARDLHVLVEDAAAVRVAVLDGRGLRDEIEGLCPQGRGHQQCHQHPGFTAHFHSCREFSRSRNSSCTCRRGRSSRCWRRRCRRPAASPSRDRSCRP